MHLKTISTGSKGNCYLIEDDGKTVILDCGVPVNEILKAIDFKLKDVICCLVTHEHKDHCKAALDLMGYGVPVFMSEGTSGIVGACSGTLRHEGNLQIGDYSILPFNVKHDCAEPLGFLLFNKRTGHKILYVTDSYNIPYKFNGLTHIIVECNYCVDILLDNINKGRIPALMKKRLMYSHLSLDSCVKFLARQDLSSCRKILLVHLSDGNSSAGEMIKTIYSKTGIDTEVASDNQITNFDLYGF